MKPSRKTATPSARRSMSPDDRAPPGSASASAGPVSAASRASEPPSAERPRIDAAMIGSDCVAYLQDVGQWSVLFRDTLRQRANNMLEHERAGLPPLLDFYERP